MERFDQPVQCLDRFGAVVGQFMGCIATFISVVAAEHFNQLVNRTLLLCGDLGNTKPKSEKDNRQGHSHTQAAVMPYPLRPKPEFTIREDGATP